MPEENDGANPNASDEAEESPLVEYCNCDWVKDAEALQDCGCRRDHHQVRLYRDTVVHWKGGHWRIECAFEDAVAMLRLAP